MAPPSLEVPVAVLNSKSLPETISEPWLAIPPPAWTAELLSKVSLETISEALFQAEDGAAFRTRAVGLVARERGTGDVGLAAGVDAATQAAGAAGRGGHVVFDRSSGDREVARAKDGAAVARGRVEKETAVGQGQGAMDVDTAAEGRGIALDVGSRQCESARVIESAAKPRATTELLSMPLKPPV